MPFSKKQNKTHFLWFWVQENLKTWHDDALEQNPASLAGPPGTKQVLWTMWQEAVTGPLGAGLWTIIKPTLRKTAKHTGLLQALSTSLPISPQVTILCSAAGPASELCMCRSMTPGWLLLISPPSCNTAVHAQVLVGEDESTSAPYSASLWFSQVPI